MHLEKYNKEELFKSIRCEDIESIKHLLRFNIDLNEIHTNNITYLIEAIKTGNTQIVKLLVDAGADVNIPKLKSLHEAIFAEKNTLELFRILIDSGASIEDEESSVLITSVKEGKYNICELLLISGADINKKYENFTALTYAAIYERIFILKLLLLHGANRNLASCVALDEPEKINELDTSDLENNFAYLIYRAKDEYMSENFISKVFDYAPNLNIVCPESKFTPVHSMVSISNIFLLEKLIKRAVNVNFSLSRAITPLHFSVMIQNLEIFNILLKAGANLNSLDQTKNKVLYHVFSFDYESEYDLKYLEVIKRLFELGIDINSKNISGNTALHLAIKKN